eukprot:3305698-Pleurochrysis_carterae.AAC.1
MGPTAAHVNKYTGASKETNEACSWTPVTTSIMAQPVKRLSRSETEKFFKQSRMVSTEGMITQYHASTLLLGTGHCSLNEHRKVTKWYCASLSEYYVQVLEQAVLP